MKTFISHLKEALGKKAKADALIKEAKTQYEKEVEAIKAKYKYDSILEDIGVIKNTINSEALREYIDSGQSKKKLEGGIGIRVNRTFEYDAVEALDWAKKSGLCLSLNKKAFEAIAKVQNIDFVTEGKTEVVTYPANLK